MRAGDPSCPDESPLTLPSTVRSKPSSTMRFTSVLPVLAFLGASVAAPQPDPMAYVHLFLLILHIIDLSRSLTERALPSG